MPCWCSASASKSRFATRYRTYAVTCECLMCQVESASEQTGTLVIGAAIASLALVLVVLGILSDPIQTTSIKGNGFF